MENIAKCTIEARVEEFWPCFALSTTCRYFIAQDAEEVRRVVMFCKVILLAPWLSKYIKSAKSKRKMWQLCYKDCDAQHNHKSDNQACHEHEKDVANIVKCKCAVLKEQEQEENFKCKILPFCQLITKTFKHFQLLEVPGCQKAMVGAILLSSFGHLWFIHFHYDTKWPSCSLLDMLLCWSNITWDAEQIGKNIIW